MPYLHVQKEVSIKKRQQIRKEKRKDSKKKKKDTHVQLHVDKDMVYIPVYPRGTIRTIGMTLDDRETWVNPISLANLPISSSCSVNV